jgi:outer membrane receptor for ferric coprogen and ferric-rhodotorulic acid
MVTTIREDDGYAPKKATVAGEAPADILEIPRSVSVVAREQIENHNFFTIGEALQQVTGITVMPFDGSNPDYRARGFDLVPGQQGQYPDERAAGLFTIPA